MSDEFIHAIIIYAIVFFVIFIAVIYMIRSIFDIPRIVRLHKTQVRLLEEIAKAQGVQSATVSGIITENQGWDPGERSTNA